MKPYTRDYEITDEEKLLNYRLSRARLDIEVAFGILHNFILTEETDFHDDVDSNANHKNGIGIYQGRVDTPSDIRDALKDYFVSPYMVKLIGNMAIYE